jgi:hypothetical protein
MAGALAYYRFQMPTPQKAAPVTVTTQPIPPANLTALADSLILYCCKSFGLSDKAFIESSISQTSGPNYHRIRQGWPMELPTLVFAKRLSEWAVQKDLQCDCVESPQSNSLNCDLKSGRIIGSQAILDLSQNANLVGREVAIIFDNLDSMKVEDIVKIIKSGVVFSYFADDQFYPSGDLIKLFSRGNVTSILRVAANDNGLRLLGKSGYQAKPTNRKKGNQPKVSSSSTGLLGRHPGAKAFVLETSGTANRKAIRNIFDEARRARLSYLVKDDLAGAFDTTALKDGVSGVMLNLINSDKSLTQFKFELMTQLLSADSLHRIAFCLDASKVDPDALVSFKILLDRIGVKLRPFMKLATEVIDVKGQFEADNKPLP